MDATDRAGDDIAVIGQIKAVPVLLDIVCRVTGVGFAAVARVTDTEWTACAVTDRLDFNLGPGSKLPIETTICNEIRESRRKVVIEDVAGDPHFCNHPTPARYGFQSYISVPILRADGTFFGTLCGLDIVARPLNQPDTVAMFETFAELIGLHLSAIDRVAVTEADLETERKTSALREQFIAVLGHDLRNPLTAILGGLEMLRKNHLTDRAAQWADMVTASAGRMAQLIDVVVDFSRSRLGGGLAVECRSCDLLEPALRQMVAELQAAKPSRDIRGDFAMPAPVQCDLRRIMQLAGNLLSNAIAYGDPDQPVRVKAVTNDVVFEFSVTNGGEPVPAALQDIIFEPFARGAVQPNREGLGLGLYISRQIALAHSGSLAFASTPLETRFTFRMPLTQEPKDTV